MSTYKIIVLYDAERNKNTGKGYYSVSLRADDPQLDEKIKKIRYDQKIKNATFKRYHMNNPGSAVGNPSNLQVKEESLASKTTMKSLNDPYKKTPFKLLLDQNTGNTTFIMGSSKMGKSTALMEIYDTYYSGKEFISILWTANPQIKLYKGHKNLLKSGVWNKQSEEVIEAEKKIQTKTKNRYKFCNMFDDVINVRNNTLIDNLLLTYRNSDMSSIISLQYSNLMSKCSRSNCNNILCFGFNTDEAIIVVIKTFLSGYLRTQGINILEDQINWYKEVTKDHSFIYIKPADGIVSFHRFTV